MACVHIVLGETWACIQLGPVCGRVEAGGDGGAILGQ